MAWLRLWSWAAFLTLSSIGVLVADDAKPAAEAPAADAAADAAIAPFTGDQSDPKALRDYAGAQFEKIFGNLDSNPDLAEKQADELAAIVKEWKVEGDKPKRLVKSIIATIEMVHERAELARVNVDELKKQLDETPDAKSVKLYAAKMSESLDELANTDMAAAEKELAATRDYLKSLADKATTPALKEAFKRAERRMQGVERSIAAQKRLLELIGQDAAPLDVSAWVNGSPRTAEDLKGKVVLLDFWAVWCGPCIMTFPHLREWNEKYHDQGLEIVGLTGYYDFKWDAEKGEAVSAAEGETVSHEDEQAMLMKFAEQHKLTHPFAISESDKLKEFYAVTGIPQVVLIDRAGKIRLIKIGAGPEVAQELGDTIKKLLAE